LGSRGVIGKDAHVQSSVLGNNVEIEDDVTIVDSHIWDDCLIRKGASLTQALLANNVIIGENAVISKGCVLGPNVVIDDNVTLPEFSYITLAEEEDDGLGNDDDDFGDFEEHSIERIESDTPALVTEHSVDVVGPKGKGHVWNANEEDDSDDSDSDDDDTGYVKPTKAQLEAIGFDIASYMEHRQKKQAEPVNDGFSEKGRDEEDERMESEAFSAYTDGTFTFDANIGPTSSSAASSSMIIGRQKGVNVIKEMKEICLEYEETSPMENLAIELNSYKFSQNASYSECTQAATLAMLERMDITSDMKDGKLVANLKHRLAFFGALLQKMSIGLEEEKSIIHGLEHAATTEGSSSAEKLSSGLSFRFLLQTLHDEEVLSEEAILSWAADRKEGASVDSKVGKIFALQSVQDFLEWLEEESEEEDSDEDGSESD